MAGLYSLMSLICACLVGLGVGMTFGVWLGIAAGAATWTLTPIHPGFK